MDKMLITHAVKNAWQNPSADGQLNIYPKRITPESGTIVVVMDGGDTTPLPTKTDWYDCFTMGTMHPNWGNLNIPTGTWFTGRTLVNHFGTFFRVYSSGGKTVPLERCNFYRRENGTVMLAIAITHLYSFVGKELYLRIYAGKSHMISPNPQKQVSVHYEVVRDITHRNAVMAKYNQLTRENTGHVSAWVNGIYRPNFKITDMGRWDDVEIVVDNSVKRMVRFRVGTLSTFSSKLDSCRKFLLHLPKSNTDWIFSDDVELNICSDNLGYYYTPNESANLRQLTHNDFSVPTKLINDYWQAWDKTDREVSGVTSINDLIIELSIREDYNDSPVIYTTDRIHELYKLDDEGIVSAMVGANSLVPEWRASSLEESPTNRLAASQLKNIDKRLCTDSYGYNALSTYFAHTPQKLNHDGNYMHCILPPLLARGCSVYEYDESGLLLGAINHTHPDTYYRARHPEAKMIEAIPSFFDESLDVVYGATNQQLDIEADHVFYLRVILGGNLTDQFIPAVRDTDYTLEDGYIKWTVDLTRRQPVIVSNKKHLFYTVKLPASKGRLEVPLKHSEEGKVLPLTIPMETVEVWLNKHSLVQGIDYHVKDGRIVIVSKVWTNDTDEELVSVRIRGIEGELRIPEHGYVVDGKLSNNDYYDVKDDKVIRVVAAGSLFDRNDLQWGENDAIKITSRYDGYPYSVDDATVPLRNLFAKYDYEDTFALRDRARDLDERVESYLSVHLPKPTMPTVQDLPHWYHLFSPVLSAVVADLANGHLVPVEDSVTDRISTQQLDTIMVSYKDLLPFDPAHVGHDARFTVVHPHNHYTVISLSELGYVLLERINHRYLNSSVQLNQYLKIGE